MCSKKQGEIQGGATMLDYKLPVRLIENDVFCLIFLSRCDSLFLKISGSSSDAGVVELRSAQRTQQVNGEGTEEPEVDNSSSRAPHLDGAKSETVVNGESNQEGTKNDSALTPRKTIPPGGEQRGSVTDFQEPREPPDDRDGGYGLPLRVPRDGDYDKYHDQNVGSLEMDNQSSFQIDDDRNSPEGLSPYRPDRARRGSLDDGGSLFSPQPFEAPEEGLSIDGGMHIQQPLPQQSHGDRCSTRGKQQERVVRGRAGLGRVTPRARSQVG